jgi:hypothetical protein
MFLTAFVTQHFLSFIIKNMMQPIRNNTNQTFAKAAKLVTLAAIPALTFY